MTARAATAATTQSEQPETGTYGEKSRGVIPFEDIQFIQSRAVLNFVVVDEYVEAKEAGNKFPPASALYDGTVYWVYDGHHRGEADHKRNQPGLLLEWELGERADAEWRACAANQRHGLRRTNEDKERAVKLALEKQPAMSSRQIADHCGVSHPFVESIRDVVQPNRGTRTNSRGKEYEPESHNPPSKAAGGKGGKKKPGRKPRRKPAEVDNTPEVKQLPKVHASVSAAADALVRAAHACGDKATVKGLKAWMIESEEVKTVLYESVLSNVTAEELTERADKQEDFAALLRLVVEALDES